MKIITKCYIHQNIYVFLLGTDSFMTPGIGLFLVGSVIHVGFLVANHIFSYLRWNQPHTNGTILFVSAWQGKIAC